MLTRFTLGKVVFLWLILLGLSGCGGGSSVQPIASIKTNAPTAPDPALIPTDTVITLIYNESMVPASLVLGGDMAGESNGGIWSSTHVANDTLTISPTSNWTARTGRQLTIDAKDTAGRAARSVDLAYDVYRGTLYYVNSVTGNDANAGMTPLAAFQNIYTAVNNPSILTPATILVAGGTYPVASGAIDTRIWLRQDISLYGGYKSDFSARDPATYPSTIQDMTSVVGTSASPNFAVIADNNYAVSKDGTGSAISNTTLVDGFTISGTLSTAADYTAAIRVLNGATPAFANNRIDGGKGAILSIGIDAVNAAPLIYSNVINGGAGPITVASNFTYGIYVSGASPRIINNLVNGGDNTSTSYAYYLSNGKGVLRNNILYGGNGTTSSTAVSLVAGSSFTTNPNIDNNILFTRTGSGSTCVYESTSGGIATPASLHNNDLFDCSVLYEGGCGGASCTTITQVNTLAVASNNISIDPLFTSLTGPDTLISTMGDNNWHFSASSPTSVTAGGLNGIDQGWSFTTDKDGVSRPASGKPWSIGAYEP